MRIGVFPNIFQELHQIVLLLLAAVEQSLQINVCNQLGYFHGFAAQSIMGQSFPLWTPLMGVFNLMIDITHDDNTLMSLLPAMMSERCHIIIMSLFCVLEFAQLIVH